MLNKLLFTAITTDFYKWLNGKLVLHFENYQQQYDYNEKCVSVLKPIC